MEKREFKRYENDAPISCRYLSDSTPVDGHMVNLSKNGLCFSSLIPFIEHSVVVVEIFMNDNDPNGTFLKEAARSICVGEIKWCREIQSEKSPLYKAGVSFYRY